MPDLFEIELADGIPVAGDGTAKTINALMEDGALATIGTKSDLPAGEGAASVVAILKKINETLLSMRVDWPDSLGTGGGLKVDGSGAPLAVSGTINTTLSTGAVSPAAFTCGITPYDANDVVGAGGGNAVMQFVAIAAGAATVVIDSVSLSIARAAIIAGETTYRLHLYNVTPPSALPDGAAFDLLASDRASYLGFIDIGTPADLGSTLYIEKNDINKIVKTVSPHLFGYLVTMGPFTPTAVAYKVTIGARQI
jgi:hypothetical protein